MSDDMTFAHVSIRSSDMERSIRFYEHHFGMKLVSRRPIPSNNAEIAFLESEGVPFKLELTWFKNQKRFEQADYENRVFDHLAFVIQDMDKTIDQLKGEKVTITDEPYILGTSKIAFIEDPDGTLIELIERK
jgi:lactoylglutathione lyase